MKTTTFQKIIFGAGLIALAILGGRALLGSTAESQMPALPPPAKMSALPSAPDDSTATTTAPALPITPAAVPANILPASPLAQVIRLAQAGVDEGIIMTYVTNSSGAFNLDSDTIIYLTNLGVPNELVAAMMQHDQPFQSSVVANPTPPPAPQPPVTQPETAAPPVAPPDQPPVTVNYFYNSLAPYGSWVDLPGYGRCWRPTAVGYNSDWQPYCDHGRWVYTDSGWYWTSDYAWGATFHYGRWFRDSRIGWCWWPDTTWAPSWVTWRYSTDYCGWAPLPPFTACGRSGNFYYRGAAVGIGFNFGLGANQFTFVPTRHFCDPYPRHYRADQGQVTRFYNNTTVINNININNRTIFNHGISPARIADATHTPVREIPVRDLGKPAIFGNYHPNRPAFTVNPNAPKQLGAPAYNQNTGSAQPAAYWRPESGHQTSGGDLARFQQSQTPSAPNRPQFLGNAAATTILQPPKPGTAGTGYHPATTDPRIQPPATGFNPQTATPRWQQRQSPDQPPHWNMPHNSAVSPQAGQNPTFTAPPRYVAPVANYSVPAPAPTVPRYFNQPRNDPRMDAPKTSFSPPPAAPVQRPPDNQPRQYYSAPAPSPQPNWQNQNGPQHGPQH